MKKVNLKPIGTIINIIKVICAIFLVMIIAVLALQRFTNNEQAIGGFRVFNVATGSMIPKYQVGDVLIVKEMPIEELKVGDDVTYLGKVGSFSGRVVTHQIIEIVESTEGKIFHTKGIANEAEDPVISGEQIYGKVVYKCIIISLLTKLMNNMTAFYIIFVIPLAILIFLQIKESHDARKEDLAEGDDDEDYENDEEDDDDDDDDEYDDEDDDDDDDSDDSDDDDE